MVIFHRSHIFEMTRKQRAAGARSRNRAGFITGGASVAHFQRFVSLTANIGRFSHELADLQESMHSLRDMLATPSPVQLDVALTF